MQHFHEKSGVRCVALHVFEVEEVLPTLRHRLQLGYLAHQLVVLILQNKKVISNKFRVVKNVKIVLFQIFKRRKLKDSLTIWHFCKAQCQLVFIWRKFPKFEEE